MTGVGILVLAVLVFGLGQGLGLSLLLRLGYLLLFLAAGAFIWARYSAFSLRFGRQCSVPRLRVGDDLEETMTLENRGFLPILWAELRDQSDLPNHNLGRVLPLGARRKLAVRVQSACNLRGHYQLGPVTAVTGDPLGLFSFRRQFGPAQGVTIYPRAAALNGLKLPIAELLGDSPRDRQGQPVGAEAFSIRDYVPGDPLNRVDWKATARQRQLMVKEYEVERSAVVWIVLDLEAGAQVALWEGRGVRGSDEVLPRTPDATEEYVVEAAASLARRLLESGYAVGLMASSSPLRWLPPERGPHQIEQVMEVLAMVRANGETPLAGLLTAQSVRFGSRDTLLVITPSVEPAWPAVLSELQHRGTRSLAILVDPASFDPQPPNEVETPSPLAGQGLPSIEVRRGQDLAAALGRVA